MKLIKKLRVRHLIDDSWVCEYNSGHWFKANWRGMNFIQAGDQTIFNSYKLGTSGYYSNCRRDYESAVQLQLKISASYGMGMDD